MSENQIRLNYRDAQTHVNHLTNVLVLLFLPSNVLWQKYVFFQMCLPLLTDLITESSFPFPLTQASKQNKISTPEMGEQFGVWIYLTLICLGKGLIELLLHSTSLLFPNQFFTVLYHKDLQIKVKNPQMCVIYIVVSVILKLLEKNWLFICRLSFVSKMMFVSQMIKYLLG